MTDANTPDPAVDAPAAPETPDEAATAPEQTTTAESSPATDAADSAAPQSGSEPAPPVPAAPAAHPAPTPRPFPGPRPTPAAPKIPAAAATATASQTSAEPFGRVSDGGTVEVREGETWRVVGEYPDGTPAEALAYFERKYADLAGEVTLLEVRHRNGGAAASDLRGTLQTVRSRVDGAAAVGDLAALEARLSALDAALSEATAEEQQAQRAAVDAAIAERTALVEAIEAIAARDPQTIQWKHTTVEVGDLFDRWQAHQSTGPRLPKSVGQQLWKRFRDARSRLDKHRREFYAQLDEQHKTARDAKSRLVERAEALSSKGEDGIGDYRALLDQWKATGRAGKKADDALWARFKAAGDALYGARADRERADTEASKEKIDAKRQLLAEAASVGAEKNTAKARSLLTGIQRRWDEIGRIFPREVERSLDDELRRIEQGVKSREDSEWKNNNPETKARQNDMTQQLRDAIATLEADLAAAEAKKDAAAIASAREALDARTAWLKALGG